MRTADLGPGSTPACVKWFLIVATAATICTGLLQGILVQFHVFPGPQELLNLSWWGLSNGFIWQPLTYFFLEELPDHDMTFSVILTLVFHLYFFWVLASALNETLGNRSFARFLITCSVLSGLIAVVLLHLFGLHTLLAGLPGVLIAVLTAWSMRFPNTPIFLFLLIPINSLYLATALTCLMLFYALLHGEMGNVVLFLTTIMTAYLYSSLAWGLPSPFPAMAPLDEKLKIVRKKLFRTFAPNQTDSDETTIIDIDTGKPPLDDNAFVDAMLDKIAKSGEDSLTWREKQRLQKISSRRTKS